MAVSLQVLYSTENQTTFDHEYYAQKHMPIVGEHMGPHMDSVLVIKGLAGGNDTELRRCSRTLGYFTPVHERGTKWDNIEEHILTSLKQAPLIGFMNLAQLKAA